MSIRCYVHKAPSIGPQAQSHQSQAPGPTSHTRGSYGSNPDPGRISCAGTHNVHSCQCWTCPSLGSTNNLLRCPTGAELTKMLPKSHNLQEHSSDFSSTSKVICTLRSAPTSALPPKVCKRLGLACSQCLHRQSRVSAISMTRMRLLWRVPHFPFCLCYTNGASTADPSTILRATPAAARTTPAPSGYLHTANRSPLPRSVR